MGEFRALFPRGLRANHRLRERRAAAPRQSGGEAARRWGWVMSAQEASAAAKPRVVDARSLRAMLDDGAELAILDLREELIFSQNHLLHARSLPLSRIELSIDRLVPRRGTRIVLCDDGDGLAERGAAILARGGYRDVAILEGGCAAWEKAGFELFSGVNVPSKAFGEFIEHESGTPSIAAEELARLMRERADIAVLDSRPFDEYVRVSIPTATNVPGAELVLRLRNAGITNKVVALRNGTMGWSLAGEACDAGKDRRAPEVSSAGLGAAREAAARVARHFGIERIDRAMLEHWRGEAEERTLYLLDVRDPADYAAGHLPG